MKKELLLFISSNYWRINKDLLQDKYDLFDEIKILTENDLDDYIKPIVDNNIEKYGIRGYGYWIWKPYIILQELNKLEEGDILVHLDVHCDLRVVKNMFNDILDKLNNQYILLGIAGTNEYMYTTTKLRKYIEKQLNYTFTDKELKQWQYESGIQFIKNCKESRTFIKQWFDLMLNGLDYVSDKYNNSNDNHETFKENRHDQSVISLLYKYHKLDFYYELNYGNLHPVKIEY